MTSNSSRITFKIIVDADSCPVKDIILRVAKESAIPVLVIASISHNMTCEGGDVRVITVDNIPQAADIAVMNNVTAGDIVVTGDYGLASLVLSKGALPMSSRGSVYSARNIDRLLLQRHIDAKIRRGGGRTKGPKAFTTEDRHRFEEVIRRITKNFGERLMRDSGTKGDWFE